MTVQFIHGCFLFLLLSVLLFSLSSSSFASSFAAGRAKVLFTYKVKNLLLSKQHFFPPLQRHVSRTTSILTPWSELHLVLTPLKLPNAASPLLSLWLRCVNRLITSIIAIFLTTASVVTIICRIQCHRKDTFPVCKSWPSLLKSLPPPHRDFPRFIRTFSGP